MSQDTIRAADTGLVADLVPSPNIEPRRNGLSPSLLVMHYTGLETVEKSLDVLSRPDCQVSCHYVIDVDGRIIQMVAESMRAWHAGVSFWRGERDVNSCSIGFEIQNPGHHRGYPDFPAAQMAAVTALAQDVIRRHNMQAESIVGHSDVAPGRKIDPGEKFDWPGLARNGVGHWVEPTSVDAADLGLSVGAEDDMVAEARRLLGSYGYDVALDGALDEPLQIVITAFQLHFRPARVDGRLDHSTLDTLRRLVASRAVA